MANIAEDIPVEVYTEETQEKIRQLRRITEHISHSDWSDYIQACALLTCNRVGLCIISEDPLADTPEVQLVLATITKSIALLSQQLNALG